MENLTRDDLMKEFKSVFWDAFHRPAMKTDKFRQLWLSLEPVNDLVSGPLFSVYETGECNYVFGDHKLFVGIKDKDDLLTWLTERIEVYMETVREMPATNIEESEDKRILLFQADVKMILCDLAYKMM